MKNAVKSVTDEVFFFRLSNKIFRSNFWNILIEIPTLKERKLFFFYYKSLLIFMYILKVYIFKSSIVKKIRNSIDGKLRIFVYLLNFYM